MGSEHKHNLSVMLTKVERRMVDEASRELGMTRSMLLRRLILRGLPVILAEERALLEEFRPSERVSR